MRETSYRVALAYSNIIPKTYRLPIIVSGVIATDEMYHELAAKSLPSKEVLMRRKDKFHNMQMAFDDVEEYLSLYEIDKINHPGYLPPNQLRQAIENSYNKLFNILRKEHLRTLDGRVKSIILRGIEGYDKDRKEWIKIEFSETFTRHFASLAINSNIQFKGGEAPEKDPDPLLRSAKILATLGHYRDLSKKAEFIASDIAKDPAAHFQVIKVRWNSPPIDQYSDFNVGPPSILIRNGVDANVSDIFLKKGLKLSMIPVDKFCKGTQDSSAIIPCKKTSKELPFGTRMTGSGSEYCWFCRKIDGFDPGLCLFHTPVCNGAAVVCGNYEFAGFICCGLFGLYLIRIGDVLKVGTAFLSNIVGRLLEQGAGKALVIHPIQGILTVHDLESSVEEYLATKLSELSKFGIAKVSTRSPTSDRKLAFFLNDWEDRSSSDLLSFLQRIMGEFSIMEGNTKITFKHAIMSPIDLVKNYDAPPKSLGTEYLKPKPLFDKASGKIVGYRGSFLFFDNGKVINLREMYGYVVRGSQS